MSKLRNVIANLETVQRNQRRAGTIPAREVLYQLLGQRAQSDVAELSDGNADLAMQVIDALTKKLVGVDDGFLDGLDRLRSALRASKDDALARNNLAKALIALGEKSPVMF